MSQEIEIAAIFTALALPHCLGQRLKRSISKKGTAANYRKPINGIYKAIYWLTQAFHSANWFVPVKSAITLYKRFGFSNSKWFRIGWPAPQSTLGCV